MKNVNKKFLSQKVIVLLGTFILHLVLISFIFVYSCEKKKKNIDNEEIYPAIQVIIQNGCGFSGIAFNLKNSLHEMNIDVVDIGNTSKFIYDETLIVVKHNDPEDLQRLKKITQIENVVYALNDEYLVPFIIITGKDYQKYFHFPKNL